MSFRFVHTADIHLDSPLRSLALKEPDIADLVATATRETFSRIIDLCLDEEVDALLIAGDLFDGELRSMKTAAFFSSEMGRLTSAGIKAYLLRGNHDAVSKLTKHLQLPDGVFVFPGRATSFEIKDKNTFLHGISFAKPKVPDSLVPKYPAPVEGAINIGLLHTSLAGSSKHDTYSPCSVEDLKTQGYDYWALGHIHKHELVSKGPQAIVMPGCPQGRHINEAGPKSVTLGEITNSHEIKLEQRSLAIVQFERIGIDLTGLSDRHQMIERVQASICQKIFDIDTRQLIARIKLTGETSLSARLYRDSDLLQEDVRLAAARCGPVHCEEIVLRTRRPTTSAPGSVANPLVELHQIALESKTRQSIVDHSFTELLHKLQTQLPPDLRDQFDFQTLEETDELQQIFENGLEAVLSRLDDQGELS